MNESSSSSLFQVSYAAAIRAALRHPEPYGQGNPECPGCRAELALDSIIAALKEILDAAERAQAGFPIESEEWYARRDFARKVLKESE